MDTQKEVMQFCRSVNFVTGAFCLGLLTVWFVLVGSLSHVHYLSLFSASCVLMLSLSVLFCFLLGCRVVSGKSRLVLWLCGISLASVLILFIILFIDYGFTYKMMLIGITFVFFSIAVLISKVGSKPITVFSMMLGATLAFGASVLTVPIDSVIFTEKGTEYVGETMFPVSPFDHRQPSEKMPGRTGTLNFVEFPQEWSVKVRYVVRDPGFWSSDFNPMMYLWTTEKTGIVLPVEVFATADNPKVAVEKYLFEHIPSMHFDVSVSRHWR